MRETVSAVVVNYQTPALLIRCLRSLEGWNDVIVVDNASGDASVEVVRSGFPSVKVIEAGENRGFGAGANLGAQASRSSAILFLNPDTWAVPGLEKKLLELFTDNPAAGAIGCGLYDPDGLPLVSARRYYTPGIVLLRRIAPGSGPVRKFELADLGDAPLLAVDWVAGSGMCVRRDAFEEIGGFDERFFLYYEDVDICRRLWESGYQVLYARDARLVHDERRASSKSVGPLLRHLSSWFKYEQKWMSKGRPDHNRVISPRHPEQSETPSDSASSTRPQTKATSVAGYMARTPDGTRAGVLRVGIESSSLLLELTGVGRSLEALVKALAESGEADLLLVAFSLRKTSAVHRYRSLAQTRGIKIPARVTQSVWDRLDMPPVELFTGNIDVFHGPNYFVPPASRAAKVVTVHDLGFIRFPRYHTRDQVEIGRRLPTSLRRADRIITVSNFTKEELIEWSEVDADRVDVVYHGVRRLPEYAPPVEGLPPEYLLYAGTLEYRKGIHLLLAAYRSALDANPDLPPLVLAGGAGPGGEEAISEAESEGVPRSKLIRLGRVDDATLGTLFRMAWAFVFPSLYEGFGLPPLEALAEGIPTVASATSSLPEILGDAALLVPGEGGPSVDDLADAMTRVAFDTETRERLARAGPERARQFTWETAASATLATYRRAAGRTR